ncbi:predicted protein [Uncinocarpus reesii 1704]|uniref:Acyltransferase 3 domain-containing protein n=1 Tax=Uncinocarpus reesii (strain UAMH 1704) TaxID=336963 RepID=C4JEM7_UNCRE|nr:uncharacterized protein UREG_02187 [Uncinocarpus reesii 1704]EEP77338.1 predicted protein [Uncinocarpus reesii 1704]
MAPPKKRDDNWIDGLRGLASFIVVTGHLCVAFAPILHSPAAAVDRGPILFQLPIFRLCVGGRAAVALFFLVTGFVNAMNPIKHFNNGNLGVALPSLARAAFTRFGRLILPTNAAALVAWVVCQFGGFNLARIVESDWIRSVSKAPGPTPWEAIKALMHNMVFFWHDGSGTYDPTHWAVLYFLRGSMKVYLTLLATSLVKTRWRVAIIILLHSFSWWTKDYITGINIYSGMLFAQLHATLGARSTSLLPKPVPTILILTGLIICSYPQNNPDWMLWSSFLKSVMTAVIPPSATGFINRYWVNIGTSTLVLGVFTSRNARRILSLPLFNFLGRVSFAVYLLHDTLIRSMLTWMIYGANVGKTDLSVVNEKGRPINRVPPAGAGVFLVAIPVFYVVLYAVAYLWTMHVDVWCANAVVRVRDIMFKKDDGGGVVNGRGGGSVAEKEMELQQQQRQPLMQGDAPVLPVTNHHVSS